MLEREVHAHVDNTCEHRNCHTTWQSQLFQGGRPVHLCNFHTDELLRLREKDKDGAQTSKFVKNCTRVA